MAATNYTYQKDYNTYTLEDYIACYSDTNINYANLSFTDIRDNIKYATYNVVSDYIDELRNEYCVTVTLNKDDIFKYAYKPKLLCFDLYGNGELAYIILIINDMYNAKQFNRTKLLLPRKEVMTQMVKQLYNANKTAINKYNKDNN